MTEDLKSRHREIIIDLPKAVENGLVHENYQHVDPVIPEQLREQMKGAEGYALGAKAYTSSFPDLTTEIVWLIQDGDTTACRWIIRGTFSGESFQGHKANDNAIELVGMTMYKWKNGQVVEGISLYDIEGFQRQLGFNLEF